ncbi:hypothetical protein [Aliikangiella maris]|uniref:Uncharacterized protein n=2 Tax=Aliikangiella maris TaxID=3162458 RepID=A0ABV2C022_9GAMM
MPKGFGKVVSHGLAGGISSKLSGGKFGHGFFSAGFTQFAGQQGWLPEIGANSWGDRIKNAFAAAMMGGTISKLTGGKFSNGAVTGAFSRILNDSAFSKKLLKEELNKVEAYEIDFSGDIDADVTLEAYKEIKVKMHGGKTEVTQRITGMKIRLKII